MSGLPDATQLYPRCGTCGNETWFDGDDLVCNDCQLSFNTDDLSASFIDPTTEPCGTPCDNSWHGDHLIRTGYGHHCHPCQLPAGHTSMHWTGCENIQLAER